MDWSHSGTSSRITTLKWSISMTLTKWTSNYVDKISERLKVEKVFAEIERHSVNRPSVQSTYNKSTHERSSVWSLKYQQLRCLSRILKDSLDLIWEKIDIMWKICRNIYSWWNRENVNVSHKKSTKADQLNDFSWLIGCPKSSSHVWKNHTKWKDVIEKKVIVASFFERNAVSAHYIIFPKCPTFSFTAAEKRFFMYWHTIRTKAVGIFWNLDATRRVSWVKIEYWVMKILSLTKEQRKKSNEIKSSGRAGQFSRYLLVHAMNLTVSH